MKTMKIRSQAKYLTDQDGNKTTITERDYTRDELRGLQCARDLVIIKSSGNTPLPKNTVILLKHLK